MKILIDTNIFHNSYYIKSADLRLMLSYINNESHVLLISDIVLKEVEKHFRDGYDAAKKKLTSALNEYNRFFPMGDETKVEHFEGFTDANDRNPIS
ncbi:PIN domain-containing protein [Cronobacter sakazakii]|uniref:PIN domain-containing protein n=1 Tax=Cronobacter sakazakii TaxID=28141 RepID=UPI000D08F55A|nr:PIN domain-containing protein [Cronobacter sakazakii]